MESSKTLSLSTPLGYPITLTEFTAKKTGVQLPILQELKISLLNLDLQTNLY